MISADDILSAFCQCWSQYLFSGHLPALGVIFDVANKSSETYLFVYTRN